MKDNSKNKEDLCSLAIHDSIEARISRLRKKYEVNEGCNRENPHPCPLGIHNSLSPKINRLKE